jgi:hypothetical protein
MVDFTGSPSRPIITQIVLTLAAIGSNHAAHVYTSANRGGQVCRAEFNVDADLHLQRVQRPNNRPADNAVYVAKI